MTTKLLLRILEKSLGPFTFGMYVRACRTSLDLSHAEMARHLGIARGTLCDIEKERQLVSIELAQKIAKKAGFSEKVAIAACIQAQLRKSESEAAFRARWLNQSGQSRPFAFFEAKRLISIST